MIYLALSLLSLILCACTYNVSLVHTEGEATDIIDTTQRTDPKTDANLSIPAGAL